MNICPTDYMCADIFTKFFTNKDKWKHALNLIGHCVPHELWTSGTSVAAASPVRADAPDESTSHYLVKLQEYLGYQHSPQRLRYYSKTYKDKVTIPWKSYLKVKHRYIKCVIAFDDDDKILDISPVARDFTTSIGGDVRIIVMHVDQRQARNTQIIASLPPQVQDIVTTARWDSVPAKEAIIHAPDGAHPIDVYFQTEKGGKNT